jgi:hypothetical protein
MLHGSSRRLAVAFEQPIDNARGDPVRGCQTRQLDPGDYEGVAAVMTAPAKRPSRWRYFNQNRAHPTSGAQRAGRKGVTLSQ